MAGSFSLGPEFRVARIFRNATPARLYEQAVSSEGGRIASSGALIARSGARTGRSPKDKRIVDHPDSRGDIWWGDVNIRLSERTFSINRQRAVDFLNSREQLYVVDGFAGWDARHRIKVRVICCAAYHALFMWNMLIRPTDAELADFGEPDYTLINAGPFPANPNTEDMTGTTTVAISFERREMVILGTEYAGEMKKGIFTVMHYLLPKQDVLSMHCSANEGTQGDVSLFFGLSGTGKTTLSADVRRRLIGDDEHGWSNDGVFNIEGGCYAKCIHLSPRHEPEIHAAIRFGAVLENVVYHEETRDVDFSDAAITENTRAAYPIEFIANARIPCVAGHPRHIVFLTCDASGVLPPVSRLTPEQAMYHFLSGYTARVAGTEVGVREPQVAFSTCFSAAFLVWHPTRYARLLAEKIRQHQAQTWLVNTGWTGGGLGVGTRIALSHTRAIIDAIHDGSLATAFTQRDPIFGVEVPTRCAGVPERILWPEQVWSNSEDYQSAARRLAGLFQNNITRFADQAGSDVLAAGPSVE